MRVPARLAVEIRRRGGRVMSVAQLYQTVTDRIIAELEQGVVPWVQPWKTTAANGTGLLPSNAVTGRGYHGINIMILWGARHRRGYAANQWLTYKQASEKGGQVRKGEKATEVVFTKKLMVKDGEDEKQISMLRGYHVFNVNQVDGLPEPSIAMLHDPELMDERADTFIKATKAVVRHGGSEACFIPSLDVIQMPPFGSFKIAEGYWATLLHEAGHWSGHKSRLDRNLEGRFGTRAYAAEELVAELTSAFLCAHLGITGELRHAGYIKNWIELLKHDERAIFTASAKAQQAADKLRSFSETIEEDSPA
jgi:antirestriction protein ArdC